jgi:hypothetical protein
VKRRWSQKIDFDGIDWAALSDQSWQTLATIVAPMTDGFRPFEVAELLQLPAQVVVDRLAALRADIAALAPKR